MEENVQLFSRIQCVSWLKNIGQSGSVEDMRKKIENFLLYPKTIKRLRLKANRSFKFPCSLDPQEIPDLSASWKADELLYPNVNENIFYKYCSVKSRGNMGQQVKALGMLQSRKIVSVKVLAVNDSKYVKGMIMKSYGTQLHSTVIWFHGLLPKKAHCTCPVGASGLCCHVLALLLYLQHYNDKKEKILQLTCTQQLQMWHRRSKKGSLPMIPLKEIKPKSAKMKKSSSGKILISK